MAAVVLGVSTPSSTDGSSFVSGSFTPAANDLLVVFVQAAGISKADAGIALSSSAGLTFDRIASADANTSADTNLLFVAKAYAAASAQTVTFACSGTATGCVITVLRVSGMNTTNRTGLNAVRQSKVIENQATATPTITFSANALTGNPTLGEIQNSFNPAAMTPPTSWTERSDTGYATPTRGQETVSRDSGFTGTSITWGNSTGSAWAGIIVELDTTTLITGTASITAPKAAIAATGTAILGSTGEIEAPTAEIAATGTVSNPPFPPEPALAVLVDFDKSGDFDDPGDDVTSAVRSVTFSRGRSADFGSDAQGDCSIELNDPRNVLGSSIALGRPVLVRSTYADKARAHFYGFVQRVTPNAKAMTTTLTLYDPLRRMSEVDVVIPAHQFVQRSARDIRIEALGEFERGTRNLVTNPEFATDTAGWDATSMAGLTLTRITTDAPPVSSSPTCAKLTTANLTSLLQYRIFGAPIFFAGVVYRASMYLRADAPIDVKVALLADILISISSKTVSIGTTWQRVTVTYTVPSNIVASGSGSLAFRLAVGTPTTAGSVYLGAVSVTRGAAFYPYETLGAGRWPNWCGNGSFDGGALNGWYDAFTNRCSNGSFETNATGWTGASRANDSPTPAPFGSWSGKRTLTGASATTFPLSGTFRQGHTYIFGFSAEYDSSGGGLTLSLGSIGTPGDAAATATTGALNAWATNVATWTPSADRSDAQLSVTGGIANHDWIDGLFVYERDSSLGSNYPQGYLDTGPGGGGTPLTTWQTDRYLSTTARWGSKSQGIRTPAARSGRIYDFSHWGSVFVAGVTYSASVWIRPSSSMPYSVSLGAWLRETGTVDEATVTGTAAAGEWVQVTLTWTPASTYQTGAPFNAYLTVYQTDSTIRDVLIDGVRVIPDAVDDFELAQWQIPASEEDEAFSGNTTQTGSCLQILTAINGLMLSNHYIRPTLDAPFYQYVVTGRDTYAAQFPRWSLVNTFGGFEEADNDRDAIINVQPITWGSGVAGTEYYSDPDSVEAYDPQPGQPISGAGYYTERPDDVGEALIARYATPRSRPTLTLHQRFPLQVDLELDDMLEVTLDTSVVPFGLVERRFVTVKLETKITRSLRDWQTTVTLEEYAL